LVVGRPRLKFTMDSLPVPAGTASGSRPEQLDPGIDSGPLNRSDWSAALKLVVMDVVPMVTEHPLSTVMDWLGRSIPTDHPPIETLPVPDWGMVPVTGVFTAGKPRVNGWDLDVVPDTPNAGMTKLPENAPVSESY